MAARSARACLWLLGACVFCMGAAAPVVYTAWQGVRAQQQSCETMLRVVDKGPNREAAVDRLREIATECIAAIARQREGKDRAAKVAASAIERLRSEVLK